MVPEVEADTFISHVKSALTPCVVRNHSFCDMNHMLEHLDSSRQVALGTSDYFRVNNEDMCMHLRAKLSKVGCKFVNNRFWEHNKGHVTRWHFDGDGVQVINICLSGIKQFDLAPPGSTLMYPFSNIACAPPPATYSVVIRKGDLLYFPAFWLHKVTCLKDNTKTYNICTLPVKLQPCLRDKGNIVYHRLLTTKLGSYDHFRSVGCVRDLRGIQAEFALILGMSVVLHVAHTRITTLTIALFIAAVWKERRFDNTHGVVTAAMLPTASGAIAVMAATKLRMHPWITP